MLEMSSNEPRDELSEEPQERITAVFGVNENGLHTGDVVTFKRRKPTEKASAAPETGRFSWRLF